MKNLVLLSLMAIATLAQAQNVGIGTATPAAAYKLHVHNNLGTDVSIGLTNNITTDANNRGARFRMLSGDLLIANNELTGKLGLRTNFNERITILSNGKVGVGVLNPISSALLEVNGDTKINGEVNRPSTGVANMVPIAYGSIAANGILFANSGNFTVSKTGIGFYEITITGENYYFLDYITNATVMPPGFSPRFISVSSVDNKLIINVFDLSGALADSSFSFVTFKP
jgi:hypothetical protein